MYGLALGALLVHLNSTNGKIGEVVMRPSATSPASSQSPVESSGVSTIARPCSHATCGSPATSKSAGAVRLTGSASTFVEYVHAHKQLGYGGAWARSGYPSTSSTISIAGGASVKPSCTIAGGANVKPSCCIIAPSL